MLVEKSQNVDWTTFGNITATMTRANFKPGKKKTSDNDNLVVSADISDLPTGARFLVIGSVQGTGEIGNSDVGCYVEYNGQPGIESAGWTGWQKGGTSTKSYVKLAGQNIVKLNAFNAFGSDNHLTVENGELNILRIG